MLIPNEAAQRGLRTKDISYGQSYEWSYDLRRRNPNEGRVFGRQVIGLQDDEFQPARGVPFKPGTSKPSAPVQFFVKLLEIWELDLDFACLLLGYERSSRSHVQAILSGAAPLETRDEKDRIAELFVMRRILHSIFRDRKVENQWLREPQGPLDGSSPLDLLLEGSWPNLLRIRQFTEMMACL
jgi:hypothetical protein